MKSIQDLLQEADPLQHEPPCDRERARQAILEASFATQFPSRARSRSRSRSTIFVAAALILIVASFFGSHTRSLFVSDLQAAVRFEVKLAEDQPAPGLRQVNRSGSEAPVYVHQEVVVTNGDIASVRLLSGDAGQYTVEVKFNASGAEKMRRATAPHIGRHVVILIDGQVVAIPLLRSPISESAVVDGNFTKAEAERIVNGVGLRVIAFSRHAAFFPFDRAETCKTRY